VFRGTIDAVTTVLFYLVIAAVIGLVVFFVAVLVFGRGEQMAPLDPRTSPAELPDHDIDSEDVRKIRFALALRGYRMSDVDWTLERLGEQISSLRLENARLRDRLSLEDEVPSADDSVPAGQAALNGAQTLEEDPQLSANGRERWAPPQDSWSADESTAETSARPQERLQERLTERAAAPAVDR
jgi:DivIVA domain-containing protein